MLLAALLLMLSAGAYAWVKRSTQAVEGVDPAAAITATGARVWYVAPDAAAGGDGSKERPLDLKVAFSTTTPVKAGDTVWLRGGTYRGVFSSYLTGTEQAPITVAPYPGERATIDSAPQPEPALGVMGPWTIYTGLEVMNSDPIRISGANGSSAADLRRGTGVEVRGAHTKIVNMVVHDMAAGMGIWSDAIAAEAYGNVIYYNGWNAPDRNHGHGIYAQNQTAVRNIADNIVFAQLGYGLHIYGSENAYLDNIVLDGNVVFNNGILDEKTYERNILLGGGRIAQSPVLRDNVTYYSPNLVPGSDSNHGKRWGGENNIGYAAGCANIDMQNNYFAHWGGGEALILTRCGGTIRGNRFYGLVGGDIQMRDAYPDNDYNLDRPTGVKVVVRPNKYAPGRANVTVLNWAGARRVDVDLSTAGLTPGASYEVRDAQDFYGPPVATGTYDGRPISLPMTGDTTARPIGFSLTAPAHTAPEFGAFVVLPAAPQSFVQRWFGQWL